MGRWEPDAESRLRAAALDLFEELGYEQTSVAAIAERAGLTARTFFRYFTDKREVLFKGSERLQETMLAALNQAPASVSAMDAIAIALTGAEAVFDDDRRQFARRRSTVIAANADLRERELIKMATLSAALTQALRERGVDALDANLAATTGIAVFRVVFAQWVSASEQRRYGEVVKESLVRLRMLAAK
jgi:AcrR family transcriptional regulator